MTPYLLGIRKRSAVPSTVDGIAHYVKTTFTQCGFSCFRIPWRNYTSKWCRNGISLSTSFTNLFVVFFHSGFAAPFLSFRVVTRGLFPELVAKNVERNLETCYKVGLEHFQIEVVTDRPIHLPAQRHVREIVVPEDYRPPNGCKFKARALQYCLEVRGVKENANCKFRGMGRGRPDQRMTRHRWIEQEPLLEIRWRTRKSLRALAFSAQREHFERQWLDHSFGRRNDRHSGLRQGRVQLCRQGGVPVRSVNHHLHQPRHRESLSDTRRFLQSCQWLWFDEVRNEI